MPDDRWYPDPDWHADENAGLTAVDRHRRARRMREARDRQEAPAPIAPANPEPRTVARPDDAGLVSRLWRALFGRRSNDGPKDEAIVWPAEDREHNRDDTTAPEFDSGRYANAVATAVRLANGYETGARDVQDPPVSHDDFAAAPDNMPPPRPAYAPHEAMSGDAGAHYPQFPAAGMMQPVAVWPAQPVIGWPVPMQAFGMPDAPPLAHAWPAMPARAYPVPPADPAPAPDNEAELDDLRESVRALRETLDALMQRRYERLGRTG